MGDKPTAIDCQSFAGGFAYGVVSAGFDLIGKREYPGGFGSAAMESNRHLLGNNWKLEDVDPGQWTRSKADLVFGNPPCSAFSNRSVSVKGKLEDGSIGLIDIRGSLSPINDCMWELVLFALECNPKIIIFESVQGAYKNGLDLMRDLHKELIERTGEIWDLHHVLHNVSSLGGSQKRARYFWVASRIPFGVDPLFLPETTVRDRIGDLENVALGSVEGHDIISSPRVRRIIELASKVEWNQDEVSGIAYQRAIDQGIELEHWDEPLVSDKGITQYAPRRLSYDSPSRVLAGDALTNAVHPTLPRTLTYREVARLSGLPDEWKCAPYQEKQSNGLWFGKGVTVEAGSWIAKAAYDAINKKPQAFKGSQIGENEYLIQADNAEKCNDQNTLFS